MTSKEKTEEHKKIIREKNLVIQRYSNEYSKIIYVVPVPKNKITKVSVKDSPAHIGNLCNSIDFTVQVGIEVYAAANGTVIAIKDDSNVSGDDPKYWYKGNYILIKHDGEFTLYEHLKFKGVVVKVRDKVKQGQVIGYSGNTGYSYNPHLHFECQKYFGDGEKDYVTLKVRFKKFKDVYK